MARTKRQPQSDNDVHLHILEQSQSKPAELNRRGALNSLAQILQTISMVSGLDVCIYPPPNQASRASNIKQLPAGYLRHFSTFCRAAKRTRDKKGCRGHDSQMTNARAASMGRPFVQTCHMGVAEVIVPIFRGVEHLGTVFIGQVVTPEIEARGFDAIWEGGKSRVTNRKQLAKGFDELSRMSEEKLLRIGMLADAAIAGLADRLSNDAFATEVRLESAPAIKRAVDKLEEERCFDITLEQMARHVHLSSPHFCRLFHRVMGVTFTRFVTDMRLHAAQTLLHQSELTIAQIAQQCGFTRQSYFTRRFSENVGMTPSAFRNEALSQHAADQ